MNEFKVSIADKKNTIYIYENNKLFFNGEELVYSFRKLSENSYLLKLDDKVYEIPFNKINYEKYGFLINGNYLEAIVRTRLQEKAFEFINKKEKQKHIDIIKAPMPGLIIKIKKKVGEKVEMGESLIILEAMKMENDLRSTASGNIKEIYVTENSSVEKDTKLLLIE